MKKLLTVGLAALMASTCVCVAGCGGDKSSGHEEGKYNLEVVVQNENGEIKMMEIWERHTKKNIPK